MKRRKSVLTAEQLWLTKLINAAGRELDEDEPDLGSIRELVATAPVGARDAAPLVCAAEAYKDVDDELPSGPRVGALPQVMEATGGVFGMWIVAGEPGLGKSTLADQIACVLADHMPVLKYDHENGGAFTYQKMKIAHRDEPKKFAARMARFYIRPSIRTLDGDLDQVAKKHTDKRAHRGLLVVDPFQSLPVDPRWAQPNMERWLLRFEQLVQDGYIVILISEKPRSTYGEATLRGFKGTGDLEYKAWVGVQLVGDPEEDDSPVEFHIVKNRVRANKGHIVNLVRNPKAQYWFQEDAIGGGEVVD